MSFQTSVVIIRTVNKTISSFEISMSKTNEGSVCLEASKAAVCRKKAEVTNMTVRDVCFGRD